MARHILSQTLDILPAGHIAGGCLTYTVAPEIGVIHYQGEIYLRGFFRTRTFKFGGEQRVNPAILHSEHVKVGQSVYVRRVKVMVERIRNDVAECTVIYDGAYPGEGTAMLDLSDPYVRLKSITGDGRVRHQSIFKNNHVDLTLVERI